MVLPFRKKHEVREAANPTPQWPEGVPPPREILILDAVHVTAQGRFLLGDPPLNVQVGYNFHTLGPGGARCPACGDAAADEACDPSCRDRRCESFLFDPSKEIGRQWSPWNGREIGDATTRMIATESATPNGVPPAVQAVIRQFQVVTREQNRLNELVNLLSPSQVEVYFPDGLLGLTPSEKKRSPKPAWQE